VTSDQRKRPPPAPGAAPSEDPPSAGAPKPADRGPSGRVQFDDRGNAVWEWSVTTGAFGREVSSQRLRKLEHPALSLADDAPTPAEVAKPNPLGTVRGYDPYDSGRLEKAKKEAPRKKDLRKLSEWISLRKQAQRNKDGGD
jgi:hypothetical protein